jgi:multidrug resistance efflux pump
VRAEISATVVQVYRENGDAVKHGDLLVKLDATAISDALMAAEANSRTAAQALEQARRQLERVNTLRTSGMVSAQAVDDAEIRRNSAQNDVEAAKARMVLARQGSIARR